MRRSQTPTAAIVGAALVLALISTAGCGTPTPDAAPPSPSAGLPVVTVDIRGHRVRAEVAATPDSRARGLMDRRQLGDDEGMLFVFPKADRHSFWMENTPLPLSAAFLEDDGRILSIVRMEPFDPTGHRPPKPVRYVLETRQGWFRDHNVRPGDRCSFTLPPGLRPR